mmetsp:Transcript_16554/g.42082  ORF Transcript_16554/g.42082 Transcript_16554/m.42082 type:complete len:248 (-) Transcript_16554:362-1105(-)
MLRRYEVYSPVELTRRMHTARMNILEVTSTISKVRSSIPGPSSRLSSSASLMSLDPALTTNASAGSVLSQQMSATSVYMPLSVVTSRVSITPRSPMEMRAMNSSALYMVIQASPEVSKSAVQGEPIAPMSARLVSASATVWFHLQTLPAWSSSFPQIVASTQQSSPRASHRIHLECDLSKAWHSGSPKQVHCLQQRVSSSSWMLRRMVIEPPLSLSFLQILLSVLSSTSQNGSIISRWRQRASSETM